jgi:hypothetical protein
MCDLQAHRFKHKKRILAAVDPLFAKAGFIK